MTISKQALESQFASLASSATTVQEKAALAKVKELYDAYGIEEYACTALFPTASQNSGNWAYDQQYCKVYYSDGTSWVKNFDTTAVPFPASFMLGVNTSGLCFPLNNSTTTEYSSPVQETTQSCWCSISPYSGIKTDGTLWSWGSAGQGRLANNTAAGNVSSPVQEASQSTWIRHVHGTSQHGIKADGGLYGWGWNYFGGIGNNTAQTCYSSPVQEITGSTWCELSTSYSGVMAIKTNGTLWGWAYNNCGQAGTNNTVNYSSPVQEASSSTNWCNISGGCNAFYGIKKDGTLWAWGLNNCGQLGTNNIVNYSSPVQEVSSSTNWSCAGPSKGGLSCYRLAIKTDGTLWGMGRGSWGVLGTGSSTTTSSPVQEACSATNWCTVAFVCDASFAIKTDGTLWFWGLVVCGTHQCGSGSVICNVPTAHGSQTSNWSSVELNGDAAKTLYLIENQIACGFTAV